MTNTIDQEPLVTGYAGRLLTIISFGTMLNMVGQLVLAPMLPQVIEDLSITPSKAGLGLTLLWIFMSLAHYPGGVIADKLSRKTIIIGSLGIAIVGSGTLVVTSTYTVFLVGLTTLGIAGGFYFTSTYAQIADLFEQRQGQAFGINAAAINLGGIVASGLAIAVLGMSRWSFAFLPIAIALAFTLILFYRWSDEPVVLSWVSLDFHDSVSRLTQNSRLRWILLAIVLYSFVWQATVTFLPTFLQVEKEFAPTLASNAFAILFLMGFLCNPIAGKLGDRFGFPTVAAGTAFLSTFGLGTMLLVNSFLMIITTIVVFAIGLMAFFPVMNAYILSYLPQKSKATDFGLIRMIYLGLSGGGSTYIGLVAERSTYLLAFAGLIACLLVTIGLTLYLASTQ